MQTCVWLKLFQRCLDGALNQRRSIFKKAVIKPHHLHFSSANKTSHHALFPHPLGLISDQILSWRHWNDMDFWRLSAFQTWTTYENEMLKHYVTMRYDRGASEEYSMATERSFETIWTNTFAIHLIRAMMTHEIPQPPTLLQCCPSFLAIRWAWCCCVSKIRHDLSQFSVLYTLCSNTVGEEVNEGMRLKG